MPRKNGQLSPRDSATARRPDRYGLVTWWTFDETNGVLELDEPALELHVEIAYGRSLAWWCDNSGRWLGMVRVGDA
jgi:hypothetical protein